MGVTIAPWRPEYETGNALIDEQHKSLFSAINALNNAMLEGQGEALLEQTIQTLKDYTTLHFETEEQFMLQHQYPDYAAHKRQHELLTAQVLEFEHSQHANISQLTSTVSHFLTQWLIHHIKDEDLKMILFCRQGQLTESAGGNQPETLQSSALAGTIAQWRPDYETGYTLIDDQHRSLFHAINALNSAMLAGRAESLLDRTFKSLRNYTTLHFETEEQFMVQYGYSDYLEHKKKHDQLREQVVELMQQEQTQNLRQLAITVSHFLTNWLIHHIKDEDLKMIEFLRQVRQQEQAKKTIEH